MAEDKNKLKLILFSLRTKSILVASQNSGWTTDFKMDYFTDVLTNFLGLSEHFSCIAVYVGSESSRIS